VFEIIHEEERKWKATDKSRAYDQYPQNASEWAFGEHFQGLYSLFLAINQVA
jgi:hypothetical protein